MMWRCSRKDEEEDNIDCCRRNALAKTLKLIVPSMFLEFSKLEESDVFQPGDS